MVKGCGAVMLSMLLRDQTPLEGECDTSEWRAG